MVVSYQYRKRKLILKTTNTNLFFLFLQYIIYLWKNIALETRHSVKYKINMGNKNFFIWSKIWIKVAWVYCSTRSLDSVGQKRSKQNKLFDFTTFLLAFLRLYWLLGVRSLKKYAKYLPTKYLRQRKFVEDLIVVATFCTILIWPKNENANKNDIATSKSSSHI